MSSISSVSCSVPSLCDQGCYGGGRSPIWARSTWDHSIFFAMSESTENTAITMSESSDDDVKPMLMPKPKLSAGQIIKDATMEDIVLSIGSTNRIKKVNQKNKDQPVDPYECTRLVSIQGELPCNINTVDLRKFCSRNLIRVPGNCTKIECAYAIVEAKEKPPKKLQKKKAASKINRLRYFNVIFSDECRQPLSMRGENLTKDQLTEGMKTDEELHRLIVKQYNNPDKHNEFAWPQLRRGVDGDPAFDPKKGPIVWMQSVEALKKVLKDYEYCVQNWQLSGNHAGFGDYDPTKASLPFSQFILANKTLLYVHEFVHLYPNVFEKATGKLPPGAFSESIKGYESFGSSRTPGSYKKKRVSHQNNFLESFTILSQKKAKSSEDFFLGESLSNTKLDIKTDKADKRRLLVDAARARLMPIGDMVKRFKGYVANKEKQDNLDDDDDMLSTDSCHSSCHSLFEECMDLSNDIAFNEVRKVKLQSKLTALD